MSSPAGWIPATQCPPSARSPGSWAVRPALPRGHTASCATLGSSAVRPRSRAVVASDGVAAALMMGAHQGVLRLSGSDDPALDLLLSAAGGGVERAVGARGSVVGLGMLAQGVVDAARGTPA